MKKQIFLGTILILAAFTLSGCAVGDAVEGTLGCLTFPHGDCPLIGNY